jgi:hypothetical protein
MLPPNQKGAIGPNFKWPLDDDLPLLYANNFLVFETEQEIILAFGNFLPTGLANRTENEITKYLDTATVNPVAKIVMAKGAFKAFFEMLKAKNENLPIANDNSIQERNG